MFDLLIRYSHTRKLKLMLDRTDKIIMSICESLHF